MCFFHQNVIQTNFSIFFKKHGTSSKDYIIRVNYGKLTRGIIGIYNNYVSDFC